MSATAATFTTSRPRPLAAATGWLQRNGWTLGLIGLLALLFFYTFQIQPRYGIFGIRGLAISVLPLALAAVGQAIVVIGGGIDLSIGSMMALTNVTAAVLMQNQSNEFSYVVIVGVLFMGVVLGAINGTLVVLTKVPDIVVTLAMSYVWAGCALLVLSTPGGAAAPWFGDLPSGAFYVSWLPFTEWIPKAAVLLIVVVAVVWLPLARTRLGVSFYAIGSNQLAAFRSGVAVGRTKIASYAVMGLFAALAGLSLTASTGVGTPVPGPYTLMSVAAIVLGGVSLAGGRGGVFGPIVAVVILQMIRTDMTFMDVNTNLATVLQGVILIGVVMIGTLASIWRERR